MRQASFGKVSWVKAGRVPAGGVRHVTLVLSEVLYVLLGYGRHVGSRLVGMCRGSAGKARFVVAGLGALSRGRFS